MNYFYMQTAVRGKLQLNTWQMSFLSYFSARYSFVTGLPNWSQFSSRPKGWDTFKNKDIFWRWLRLESDGIDPDSATYTDKEDLKYSTSTDLLAHKRNHSSN